MSGEAVESEPVIHALVLNVINRETGEVEAQSRFFPSEAAMPGYVEMVERGYEDSPWRTERVWLLPLAQPTCDADRNPREEADKGARAGERGAES